MQANEYQKQTATTAIYSKDTALSYLSLGLAAEGGEVAGKVAKYFRDGTDLDDLAEAVLKETGDVLWFCSELCSLFGYTLEECMQANIDKLQSRKDRNVLSGSGDTR